MIGTAAAWCVERTDLPGRRVWAVLVVVPLAIPDFVVSFGWNSLWTWAHGFRGAVIVMTLAVYPLVYLPVAASLRGADPGSGGGRAKPGLGPRPHLRPDHARPGQGRHPGRLPAGRACPAGRVRRVRDPRLPDLHHRDLHRVQRVQLRRLLRALPGARPAQPARPGRRGHAPRAGGRVSRSGPMTQRVNPPQHLGWTRWPVLAAVRRAGRARARRADRVDAVLDDRQACPRPCPAGPTSPCSTPPGTPPCTADPPRPWPRCMAFPVALLAVRHSGPGAAAPRAQHLPGPGHAGSGGRVRPVLLHRTLRWPGSATGHRCCSSPATRSCSSRSPWSGSRRRWPGPRPVSTRWPGPWASARLAVLFRVTMRLAGPGLVAAFCLVFLSAVTELTATLLLIPTGAADAGHAVLVL